MDEEARLELERLKHRHTELRDEMEFLNSRLRLLERRLSQPEPRGAAGAPPPQSPVIPAAAPAEAGREQIPEVRIPQISQPPATRVSRPPEPIAVPPVIPRAPAATQSAGAIPAPAPAIQQSGEPGPDVDPVATGAVPKPGPIPVPPPLPQSPTTQTHVPRPGSAAPAMSRGEKSFEMRLGTYWLVRIGIVMLLTGLVFFGNYAYQNYIGRIGPAGKVSLLYLASGLLLGAGTWWQRKAATEALRNYAQVLFAGGLAAVYFTTFAAHHIEKIRVIESPALDGFLLLGWAGFMVRIADRKKSEVLALFAIGLAYYTSIITRVGYFTLYSNLVLTLAALFFLVRNRWATVSLASLAATYAGYGYWRFYDGSQWHWASPESGLWSGVYFLASYWLVFTLAVFLSKHEKFAGEKRAGFLTLNNGAFFVMFLLTMLQVRHGGFWKFALTYGSVMLILAEAARRLLVSEPLSKNCYLSQGLLLITVGLISHPRLAGLNLGLVLAMESVILLISGQRRENLILLVGAYLTALLALAWGMDGMLEDDTHGLWLAVGLGALMMVNTVVVHRRSPESVAGALRPQPSFFIVLALAIWLVATHNNTTHEHFPLALAVEGIALTLSIYILRVREIALLSQGYIVLAQLAWLFHFVLQSRQGPVWWNSLVLIALTLGISHWWQKQTVLKIGGQVGLFFQGLFALAMMGVIYVWQSSKTEAPIWLAMTSGLALGITAYGVLTRAWLVAAFGQIFMLLSAAQFVMQLSESKPHWHLPLAPIAALSVLSFATVKWFERKQATGENVREPLLQVALLYRWTALVMSIWWVCEYISERERIWLLALLGLWSFIWAGLRRNREALLFCAAFTATALALFWLPLLEASKVYWPNLIVIVVLLAQRQIARRLPERYPLDNSVHAAVIVIGGLSIWLYLSRWVLESENEFYLSASWSGLALVLFACGIVLRERVYRWLGLGVLACALGRVVLLDVWKLETLYRILSFMALGIVLLVLGFIYNKYQEKIKQWL
jgi:uncharacterized membrane protein